MISRIFVLLLLLTWTTNAFSEEEKTAEDKPHPSLLQRMTHPFHREKKTDDDKKKSNKLELTMVISPDPVKLSASHQLQVVLTLTNSTGKLAQLDFPTTQRIEVLLRNEAGKIITQWSENQSFSNDPGYVTIDPREHVEYSVTISGRDLVPGKRFTVEGFLPNYENLRVAKTIIPER